METLRELSGLMILTLFNAETVAWLAFVCIAGWVMLPLSWRMLGELRVGWYFASRVAALPLIAYIPWVLSHGPPEFSHLLLAGTMLALLLIAIAFWMRNGKEVRNALRQESRRILVGEALFLGVFLLMAALRLVSHGIVGQEKFMDMAFFRACLEAGAMPPFDPWLFRSTINYYYGGYLIFSLPARVLGTEPAMAYNLALPLLHALAAIMAYALALEITRRIRWAMLGVFLALFAGNLEPLFQIARHIRNTPHAPPFLFDWWSPTRVIHDQLPAAEPAALINEFPFFAAYLGDLHPHLMVIPFSLLFGLLLLNHMLARSRPFPTMGMLLLIGWSLGLLLFINPFDALSWGGAAFLIAVLPSCTHRQAAGSLQKRQLATGVLFCLAILAVALLLFLPFLAHYNLPKNSDDHGALIQMTEFRSHPIEFLKVWGLFVLILGAGLALHLARMRGRLTSEGRFLLTVVLIAGAALAMLLLGGVVGGLLLAAVLLLLHPLLSRPQTRRRLFASALLMAGLLLLLACELLHINDSYGRDLQRMNTVFKFHFVAWVMVSLGILPLVRSLCRSCRLALGRGAPIALLTSILLLGAIYPLLAIDRRVREYESLQLGWPSLDGMRFLARDHPADHEAIIWLNQNAQPGDVLLEAVGPPYGIYARVSVFSPVRAVLGWENHQRVWRGQLEADIPGDIQRIYSSTSAEEKTALLQTYGVRYVFVGDLERRDYPEAGLTLLEQILEPLFVSTEGNTVVYGFTASDGTTR